LRLTHNPVFSIDVPIGKIFRVQIHVERNGNSDKDYESEKRGAGKHFECALNVKRDNNWKIPNTVELQGKSYVSR